MLTIKVVRSRGGESDAVKVH